MTPQINHFIKQAAEGATLRPPWYLTVIELSLIVQAGGVLTYKVKKIAKSAPDGDAGLLGVASDYLNSRCHFKTNCVPAVPCHYVTQWNGCSK